TNATRAELAGSADVRCSHGMPRDQDAGTARRFRPGPHAALPPQVGGLHPLQGVSAFHVGRQGREDVLAPPLHTGRTLRAAPWPARSPYAPKTSSRRCAMALRATLDP